MTWFMGIDIGSETSKGIIIAKDGKQKAAHLLASGANYKITAHKLREELLTKAGLQARDINRTVTTGQGSGLFSFSNEHVADILCCAKGITQLLPSVRMVIDVQGQSSQVIRLDGKGQVIDFAINEICASGSGHLLRIIANVLQLEIEDIGPLSLKSVNPVTFTTGCAVFGESEAVSRVAEGISKEDILGGIHKALAGRIVALVKRLGLEEPCAISGGCGLNIGLVKRLEEMGIKLLIPHQPQLTNALGAAIIAEETVDTSIFNSIKEGVPSIITGRL